MSFMVQALGKGDASQRGSSSRIETDCRICNQVTADRDNVWIRVWRATCSSTHGVSLYSTPLADKVIGRAIEVHRTLGPGLLESVYEECLAYELAVSGIPFVRGAPLPVVYKNVKLDCGYRIDFLVEQTLLLELKAVEQVLPIHRAQTLTYLKLLGLRQALLINFNVPRLVCGLKSFLL